MISIWESLNININKYMYKYCSCEIDAYHYLKGNIVELMSD